MHTVVTEIDPMGGDDERDRGFPLSSIDVHWRKQNGQASGWK